MAEQAPPLTGGYPVVGLVTYASAHETCGWVLLGSGEDGTEVIETGVGTTSKALNLALVKKALAHAEQRRALIRTWRTQLNDAVADIGAEAYLDVPSNIRDDDTAYLAALDTAAELAGERAQRREASGFPGTTPLVIAVDGSRSRAGRGAWAWISEDGLWDADGGDFTSPLHAEVAAIHAAIRSNSTGRALRILCDSRDAVAQANRALAGDTPGDTVKFQVARLLGAIARQSAGKEITVEWVKGHNGHPLNDRADRLAVLARRFGGLTSPQVRPLALSIADLTPAAA